MVQIGTPLSELGPFQLLENSPSIINGLQNAGAGVIPAPITSLAGRFNSYSGGLTAQGPVAGLDPSLEAKQTPG
jgi:hypothetical protein